VLTPWSRIVLKKLKIYHLVKKFSAFYGNRRLIAMFITVRHWFLPEADTIIEYEFKFPMVSVECFIDIILLAALWPWVLLSL
jgi:hypothetical protein